MSNGTPTVTLEVDYRRIYPVTSEMPFTQPAWGGNTTVYVVRDLPDERVEVTVFVPDPTRDCVITVEVKP